MRRLPLLLLTLGVGNQAWAQDAFPAPSLTVPPAGPPPTAPRPSEPPPTETVTPSPPPVATENDETLATEVAEPVAPVVAPVVVAPAPAAGAATVVDGSSTNAGAMAAQPMSTPEFPSGPAWIDNSYAELGAAVRAFRERLAEHADDEVMPPAPKEPEGVSATSVNGALAGLAAMVAAQQTPPQAAAEPVATNAPVEKKKFEQKTLFGTTRRSGRFGAHIGFTGLASQYDGNDSAAWGVEGGFVLGSAFLLGGGVYATDMVSVDDSQAVLAYGGFQPGLILWTKSVIHPRLDMLLGGGVAFDAVTGAFLGEAAVVVPRLGLELNISRALRASGNLGWRFVGSSSPETQDFSSFEAGFSIRLGWM